MKLTLLTLATLALGSNIAFANNSCLSEAKLQARAHSAKGNRVSMQSIGVKSSFYHSESNGILYYGVLLDNDERLNVGLRKKDCVLAEINYVTDGL